MEMIDLLRLLVITGMISCEYKGGVRLVVRVGKDVVLPCSLGPEVDIEPTVFDWTKDRQDVFLYNSGIYRSESLQFRGRVSHFPDELKKGNASIIIRNIQLPDSGNYSCFFPHLQQQRFNVELLVGVSPKPYVSILSITEDWAVLQCEIRGAFPKTQISWLDRDGIVLPAEEKLEDSDGLQHPPALMLQTTVNKSGIFSCRVVQQELNHINEVHIYPQLCSCKTVTGSNGEPIDLVLPILSSFLFILAAVLMVRWMYRSRVMIEKLQAELKAERSTVEKLQAELKAERSTVAESWDKLSLRSSDSLRNRHMKAVQEPKGFRPPQNNRTETFDSGVSFPHPSDDLTESCDSDVSTNHSSDSLPERSDTGVSTNHSSDFLTTLQETGEPKLKAAPDETSEMILKEMEIM